MKLLSESLMRQDLPLHIDMLTGLQDGCFTVCYDSQDGCVLFDQMANCLYVTARDTHAFCAMKSVLGPCQMAVAHQGFYLDELMQLTCTKLDLTCYQLAFLGAHPIGVNPPKNIAVAPIPQWANKQVIKQYGHSEDYVAACMEKGGFLGAFDGETLAGFIGVHSRGAMGFLQVLSNYRRLGLGFVLEASLINLILQSGRTPFAQVVVDNTPSLALQKKLGMVQSKAKMYYLFSKD